jgi:hypothetical protein
MHAASSGFGILLSAMNRDIRGTGPYLQGFAYADASWVMASRELEYMLKRREIKSLLVTTNV